MCRESARRFYLKYIIEHLDGSTLIKTKLIIKKYVKDLKRGYPPEFVDQSTNQDEHFPINSIFSGYDYRLLTQRFRVRIPGKVWFFR
jgi:hypothetical protein